MEKECEICRKIYKPKYNTERLNTLSKYCDGCVNEIIDKHNQDRQDILDNYNYNTEYKSGYNYKWYLNTKEMY